MSLKNWSRHFPETTPRPLQREVLDFLVDRWTLYDNFIIEAPTGVGKSAIAVCLARVLSTLRKETHGDTLLSEEASNRYKTYITTTTLELQDQYERCYSNRSALKKLYSSDNYDCNDGKGLTCADGARINAAKGKVCPGLCPYRTAKENFIASDHGVLNLAYYVNETYYKGDLKRRGLMVFDEAHTVSDCVKSFVSLEVNEYWLSKFESTDPPRDKKTGECDPVKVKSWLQAEYLKKGDEYDSHLQKRLTTWRGSKSDSSFFKLCRECTELDKYLCRLRRVIELYDHETWVIDETKNEVVLTPLYPRRFVREVATGRNDKNVFMTATILDHEFFIREHDLDKDKTCFVSLDSPFAPENRRVYIMPCGRLKFNDLSATLTPFIPVVKMILEQHKGERGIVFVNSYAQAFELVKVLGDKRLLVHRDAEDKRRMMEEHAGSTDTVIVSPSMHEGVDLKDDLSRFQVIMKLPFASLGTKSVKRRMELEPEWYAYKTALKIVQACGRSIRSETDSAATYVLDSDFGWFYKKWKDRFFPGWWKKALVF